METIKCIKTRRSIRKFLNKEISDETLKEIIDVVRYSPSSIDCQPWEIIVVKKQEVKKKIFELKNKFTPPYLKELGFTNDLLVEAPVLLFVCVDLKKSPSRWIEDGTIAAYNILLAINELGLGGVYVTAFSSEHKEIAETIKKILNLPENIMPVSIIPLGYPNKKEKLTEKQLKRMDEITHYEGW